MHDKHIPTHPLVFQCPLCKDLTQMTQFQTDASGLSIQCSLCRGEIFIPIDGASSLSPSLLAATLPASAPKTSNSSPAMPANATPPAETPPDTPTAISLPAEATQATSTGNAERCPKCGHLRSSKDVNCHKCGLLFANIGKTFDPERYTKPQNALEAHALGLWETLRKDWDNEAAHNTFIQYCSGQDLLELAAHLYRTIKDQGDDPRAAAAAQHLAHILEMVQAQFFTAQPKGDAQALVRRGKWALVGVLLVFALIAFYIIWGKMSGGGGMQIQMP